MRRCAVVLAAFVLTACQSVPGAPVGLADAPAAQPAPKPICPPWRPWSDADRAALGKALAPVTDPLIIRMALDWRRYYGDAKACAEAAQYK